MMGSSRETYSGLRARLDRRRRARGMAKVPGDLFAAADLIGRDSQLRGALSDAGQPSQARVGLVEALFAPRLSAGAVEVLKDVAAQRWSDPTSMLEAVEGLAAQAAFIAAEGDATLDRVEGEIFSFSRVVARSADLQMALTDPSLGSVEKSALIESLLAGRAAPGTRLVLAHALSHLRGRRAEAVLSDLMDLAAEQRNRSVAEVRVAIALQPEQEARLMAALSRLHGREVRLNVAVDPDVIGGVQVRIGDDVFDATVATRIEQARRALVG